MGLAARVKGLDDDHAPAAARARVPLFVCVPASGAIALAARRGWVGHAKELAGQCDAGGPIAVGQEAIVTDAVKPVGQHMDQEAADELVGIERHQLVASVGLGPIILPFEGHALAVDGDEPAVGDGDAMGVAGQVGERGFDTPDLKEAKALLDELG